MAQPFGKYVLLDRINQGGMAEVYLAKMSGFRGTEQIIALKRIRKEVSDTPAFVEMFVHEAKLTVLLSHANIAQTFELGKHESHYYIAMEYVAGKDLRAVLARANSEGLQIPEHLTLHVLAAVLEGLDYAHRKIDHGGAALGIVHRDVSPHNVIISYAGDVKLIDFGIAKARTADESQAGVLKGKYGYMSPEQVLGRDVDARTDIFAAGVLLYELLTQQRLFDGASDFSILEKVRYAEVYPPRVLAPHVPAEVERIVLKALAATPEERFQSASDMHDAIVGAMLQLYGHPTPRELANLMRSLFAKEIAADARLLDQARRAALPAAMAQEASATDSAAAGSPRVPDDNGDGAPDGEPVGEAQGEDPEEDDEGTDPERVVERTAVSPAPADAASFVPEETTQPDVVVAAAAGAPKAPPPQASAPEGSGSGTVIQRRPGRVAPVSPVTKVRLDQQIGTLNPTKIRPALRRSWLRDHVIIVGAVAIALALILASWLVTRADPTDRTGQVMILSLPQGASVILDGVVVGRTPYSGERLPAGRHTMTLELAGYQIESRVIDVVPSEMLPVQLVLKPTSPPTAGAAR